MLHLTPPFSYPRPQPGVDGWGDGSLSASLFCNSFCYFTHEMVYCAASGCSNHSGMGKIMHRFPRDPARRKAWETQLQRERWTPHNNSYLCSDHFEESQYEGGRADNLKKLKPYAVPSLFFSKPAQQRRPRPLRAKKPEEESDPLQLPDDHDLQHQHQPHHPLQLPDDHDLQHQHQPHHPHHLLQQAEEVGGGVCGEATHHEEMFTQDTDLSDMEIKEEVVEEVSPHEMATFEQEEVDRLRSPTPKEEAAAAGGGELSEPLLSTITEMVNKATRPEVKDEFYLFGMNVASQLRAMPLRAALEAQLDIQKVLTLKRFQSMK